MAKQKDKEATIASNTEGPVEVNVEPSSSNDALSAALKANERLNKDINRLEDEVEQLKNELALARADVDSARLSADGSLSELSKVQGELRTATALIESLHKTIQEETKKHAAVELMVGDCAYVDGKVFRVVHRCTAKWLNQEVLRRHVDEDATTLVLDRSGE